MHAGDTGTGLLRAPPPNGVPPNVFLSEDGPARAEIEQLTALLHVGCFAEAEIRAARLTNQYPRSGRAWKALAASLLPQGKDAIPALQRTVELQPKDKRAYAKLWSVLFALGRTDESIASYRHAIAINPDFAEAHFNLGNACLEKGDMAAAQENYHRAIAIKSGFAEAHFALGNVLLERGHEDEALSSYGQALACQPTFIEAHVNLGNALLKVNRPDEAIASYQRALAISSGNAQLHTMLGNALVQGGRLDEAATSFQQALAIEPNLPETHSSLLFCYSHSTSLTDQQLFAEHCRFAESFEAPLRRDWPQHARPLDSERRLQVGFVSGDFRDHAVAHFFEPVLALLRQRPFLSLHAYHNHTAADNVTLRLQDQFAHWHAVAHLSDVELAQKIRADGIDILIDLSGHTANNRLLVFARKPAPIQISWIGYPNTSGLQAMDYVFCDRYSAPYGVQETYYIEKFARLPSATAFRPHAGSPEIGPLPALTKGYVTFASFNRPEKLTESVIATWSRVLLTVPASTMLLGNISNAGLIQQLTLRFAAYGIGAERLVFRPKLAMRDYLSLHHEVDMVLDAWPYTGGTTTNFALWMGVPVVTLRGTLRAHCQSAAALGRCGLVCWVASDREEFVRIAVHWAQTLPDLAELRMGMRKRLLNQSACQPATVADGVARALRFAWQRWCQGLPAEHFEIDTTLEPDAKFMEIV